MSSIGFAAGDFVRNFRIVRPIGSGNYGDVYLADEFNLQDLIGLSADRIREVAESKVPMRQVALKFPKLKLPAESLLTTEVTAAYRLNHPNVCRCHVLLDYEGCGFAVMEYVDGRTLEERLKESEITSRQILPIALQIARALEHAHELGIVHRDLKPDNVMVTISGEAKVLDFGLARFGRAADRTICGTPDYMSPEHWTGDATPASDVWSFGVILYQLLCKEVPFRPMKMDDGWHPPDFSAPYPEPAQLESSLTRDLFKIIQGCLRVDGESRYKNGAELRRRLALLRDKVAPLAFFDLSPLLEYVTRPPEDDDAAKLRHKTAKDWFDSYEDRATTSHTVFRELVAKLVESEFLKAQGAMDHPMRTHLRTFARAKAESEQPGPDVPEIATEQLETAIRQLTWGDLTQEQQATFSRVALGTESLRENLLLLADEIGKSAKSHRHVGFREQVQCFLSLLDRVGTMTIRDAAVISEAFEIGTRVFCTASPQFGQSAYQVGMRQVAGEMEPEFPPVHAGSVDPERDALQNGKTLTMLRSSS